MTGVFHRDSCQNCCQLWSCRYTYYRCRRGDSNEQVFSVLSEYFVVFLFLATVHQLFLCILVVFRCCYMARIFLVIHSAVCWVIIALYLSKFSPGTHSSYVFDHV